jgi:hypothetical protein
MFELYTAAEAYEIMCCRSKMGTRQAWKKKQKKKQPSKTSKINKAIPNKLPQTEDFSFLFFPLQKKHFKNHGG